MEFFASAITTLQTLVVALGAGLGVWGVVNLLEGYGSDNPGSKNLRGTARYRTEGVENKRPFDGSNFCVLDLVIIPII